GSTPQLVGNEKTEAPAGRTFLGYDRLADGVRLRWRAHYPAGVVQFAETLRLRTDGGRRRLIREYRADNVPAGHALEPQNRVDELPAPQAPPARQRVAQFDPGPVGGSLERPGYRAIAFPRPKTAAGDDLVMPSAL